MSNMTFCHIDKIDQIGLDFFLYDKFYAEIFFFLYFSLQYRCKKAPECIHRRRFFCCMGMADFANNPAPRDVPVL